MDAHGVDTVLSTDTPASSKSSRSSRRTCLRPACHRVLGSFLLDPHSVCIKWMEVCNPGNRCVESSSWLSDILKVFHYQRGLRRKRDAKDRQRHQAVEEYRDSASQVSAAISEASVQSELIAEDSASQQGSKLLVAIDLSLSEVLAGSAACLCR